LNRFKVAPNPVEYVLNLCEVIESSTAFEEVLPQVGKSVSDDQAFAKSPNAKVGLDKTLMLS